MKICRNAEGKMKILKDYPNTIISQDYLTYYSLERCYTTSRGTQGGFYMQWKLTHKNQRECIENEGGKTLSYDPNLGIKIIERDGYAFKDLNNNGELDPFEDWRLPLSERVKDFTTRFHLWQEGECLYYKKGKIALDENFCEFMTIYQNTEIMQELLTINEEDRAYLKDNSIVAMLLLMFDNDYDTGKEDYLLQMIMQSMDLGVLENILYSVMEALKKFIQKGYQQSLHPIVIQ